MRRTLAGVAVVTTSMLPLAASKGAAAGTSAETSSIPASTASSFVDGVGVNLHLGYAKTSYASTDRVLTAVQDLGIRHVRDSLPMNPNQRLDTALRQLPAHGLSADLVLAQVPDSDKTLPDPKAVLRVLNSADVRGSLESLEVSNEWDHHKTDNWSAQIADWTREISRQLKADPSWKGVTLIGPSTSKVDDVTEIPDLSAAIDISNLHIYTAGGPPERQLSYLDKARQMAPGKPLYVTELGFHTAVKQTGRQPAVTEAQQGSYLLRQLLENYRSGVGRSYVYELLEERPEPALENQERHFGLLHSDFSPKPSYLMLQRLLHELDDGAPSGGSVAPLDAKMSTTGNVQSLLFGRSDGSYRLVLWTRGRLGLDGRSKQKDASVRLSLPDGARQVSVVRTAGGVIAGGPEVRTDSVEGRVGGDPVILEIGAAKPGAAADSGRTVSFDASGAAPGAAAVPRGYVGRPAPSRVIVAVIGVTALLAVVIGATMLLWRRWRRRPR